MNTTGIQNYLSNVFRPVVVYDTVVSNFVPKLEMSNIDNYSGNTVTVFTAAVGDSANNVYVGKEAGNIFSVTRACSNVTAVGYAAGSNISNVSNSVFLGFYAGASASNANNVIAIGANATGNGFSNIFIGSSTGTTGNSNIFIGHSIAPSNVSNQIRVGMNGRIPIAADLTYNWVGLGGVVTPTNLTYATIDISGSTRIQGNLGINTIPGARTLDVVGNFRVQDSSASLLDFSNGLTRIQGQVGINTTPGARTLDVSGNFRAQDSSTNILDFSNGVTTSSKGFISIQSNVTVPGGQSVAISPIKKGVSMISILDTVTPAADYLAVLLLGTTASNVALISGSGSGTPNIIYPSTDYMLSNSDTSSHTYNYSITYFPLT